MTRKEFSPTADAIDIPDEQVRRDQRLRYSPRHQALHWITALLIASLIPIAWVMVEAKEEAPFTIALYKWHETLGIFVLLLTIYRLGLRIVQRPPALPAALARWDRALAHATYALFYSILIAMPVTGYLGSIALGYPLKLFNLIDTPSLFGKDEKFGNLMLSLHDYGSWAVYALIVLHIAGVAFQLVVTRSGILGRMLPADAVGLPEHGSKGPGHELWDGSR